MKKIKIKDFVEDYNKRPKQTKETYIKDNLEIVSYIPLAKKIALVDKLIDVSMYEFEDYVKENGEKSRRRTNRIKVDSVVQYFLFCRTLIEAYTNLEIETDNFFEEYKDESTSKLLFYSSLGWLIVSLIILLLIIKSLVKNSFLSSFIIYKHFK